MTKTRKPESLFDAYAQWWTIHVLAAMIDLRMNGIDKP